MLENVIEIFVVIEFGTSHGNVIERSGNSDKEIRYEPYVYITILCISLPEHTVVFSVLYDINCNKFCLRNLIPQVPFSCKIVNG